MSYVLEYTPHAHQAAGAVEYMQEDVSVTTIQGVTRQISKELSPLFEQRLRSYLATQDKEWLVEQIVRLTMDAHSLQEMDHKIMHENKAKKRDERIARLREIALDRDVLARFVETYKTYDRARLINDGFLLGTTPVKGTDLIKDGFRTEKGAALLTNAKDMLFGMLYGDETTNTDLKRIQEVMLSITLARHKAIALDLMKASTEMSAFGTWQDPESVSNDVHADDVVVEVEFGDVEGELVATGILRALSLINNLEVNEEILYARMIEIEKSTLIQ